MKAQCDVQHRDTRGDVARVLFDLRRKKDERRSEGKQSNGERHRPAVEQLPRQPGEQNEREQSTQQREQPQREFGSPQRRDYGLLHEDKHRRRDLRVFQAVQQGQDGPVDDVARDGRFIDPQGRVGQVLPDAQHRAHSHERDRGHLLRCRRGLGKRQPEKKTPGPEDPACDGRWRRMLRGTAALQLFNLRCRLRYSRPLMPVPRRTRLAGSGTSASAVASARVKSLNMSSRPPTAGSTHPDLGIRRKSDRDCSYRGW